jgi:hypothetical protein
MQLKSYFTEYFAADLKAGFITAVVGLACAP